MRLYGDKFFSICYLADGGKTREEANSAETFWIKYLDSNNSLVGYNLTSGGGVGRTLSESSKKKIGDACRKPNSDEQECCGCRKIKSLDDYHVNNAVSNKRMSRCKECNIAEGIRRYWEGEAKERAVNRELKRQEKLTRTEKWCQHCKKNLPLDYFFVSKTSIDGRLGTCKKCRNLEKRKTPLAEGGVL